MALPDFLGIGAQRAGSTWLHELLSSHPGLYLPTRRKEIHYFDKYFSRGQTWYESFFSQDVAPKQALGEVTPDYLHSPRCAERIAKIVPRSKLIVILRNPAVRAYSHYKKLVKDDNCRKSFEDVLATHPDIIERGYYASQLSRYLKHFDRNKVCVLIYEDAVTDVERTKQTLATFLEVDPKGFAKSSGQQVIHKSFVPRARAAYAASKRLARGLHEKDMDWLVNWAKAAHLDRMFGQANELLPPARDTMNVLRETYHSDILELEHLLDINLEAWKEPLPV